MAWSISSSGPKLKPTKKKSVLFNRKNPNPKTLDMKKSHNKMQVLQKHKIT